MPLVQESTRNRSRSPHRIRHRRRRHPPSAKLQKLQRTARSQLHQRQKKRTTTCPQRTPRIQPHQNNTPNDQVRPATMRQLRTTIPTNLQMVKSRRTKILHKTMRTTRTNTSPLNNQQDMGLWRLWQNHHHHKAINRTTTRTRKKTQTNDMRRP